MSEKKYRYFTEEEDTIIIANFAAMQRSVCTLLPDRSPDSVMARARLLGLTLTTHARSWSDEEDDILKKYYPKMGFGVLALLPNRTKGGVQSRVKTLKIRRITDWTREEDRIIKDHNFELSKELLKALPKRTKSAVAARAQFLANKHRSEIQYPLNVYMTICGTYVGYDKIYPEFETAVDNIIKAAENNKINPDIGVKIAKVLELTYKEYMDTEDVAYEMDITPEQAKDLLDRGIKLMRHFLLKKK